MNMHETGVYSNNAISVQSSASFTIWVYSKLANVGNLIQPYSNDNFCRKVYAITPKCLQYYVLHMLADVSTRVSVMFPPNKPNTIFVEFRGLAYYGGEILDLELTAYSTAMVQSYNDLTGAVVSAVHPVGFFCGCDSDISHQGSPSFRSDMVPGKDVLGLQFIVMAYQQIDFSHDEYVILATRDYTVVTVISSDLCKDIHFDSAGDSRVIGMEGVNEIIMASEPIVLVHLPFNMAGSPNMYYVKPIGLFKRTYSVFAMDNMAIGVRFGFFSGSEDRFEVNDHQFDPEVLEYLHNSIAIGQLDGPNMFRSNSTNTIRSDSLYRFGGYVWNLASDGTLYITALEGKGSRIYSVRLFIYTQVMCRIY